MDLYIRSQDKEVLTKVNNLCYYTRKDVVEFISEEELSKDIQHVIWSPDGSILGYYKTKERALEVLDEIQNIIKIKFALQCDKEIAFNGIPEKDINYLLHQCAVFDMPQE